jgi:hypothetical protein
MRFLCTPGGDGPQEWLDIIHEINRIKPGALGRPDAIEPWWAGGEVEEYPDFRVIHRDDSPTVNIEGKTTEAIELIRQAAENLGLIG